MKKNGSLVAVIVTFNRLDPLKVTLEHAMTKGFYRIVVVDNCSTDGTRGFVICIRRHAKRIDWIPAEAQIDKQTAFAKSISWSVNG